MFFPQFILTAGYVAGLFALVIGAFQVPESVVTWGFSVGLSLYALAVLGRTFTPMFRFGLDEEDRDWT